mmetsp:Transcript_169119/g.325002  ORF Transcript_169119/g.325002 Transcript_169119/m.325002 type:complete len:255 (-) Transcript_169119:587-1351(-)
MSCFNFSAVSLMACWLWAPRASSCLVFLSKALFRSFASLSRARFTSLFISCRSWAASFFAFSASRRMATCSSDSALCIVLSPCSACVRMASAANDSSLTRSLDSRSMSARNLSISLPSPVIWFFHVLPSCESLSSNTLSFCASPALRDFISLSMFFAKLSSADMRALFSASKAFPNSMLMVFRSSWCSAKNMSNLSTAAFNDLPRVPVVSRISLCSARSLFSKSSTCILMLASKYSFKFSCRRATVTSVRTAVN